MSWVLQVVAPYLGEPAGKPSGGNYPFRCPFHAGGQESNPSFFLHGESGLAFCHACNQGWNLTQLLRKFGARAALVAQAAQRLGPPKKRRKSIIRSETLPAIPEQVMGILLEYCPAELLERGFDKDLLYRYEVGFDPYEEVTVYPIRDLQGRLVALSGRYPSAYILYGERQLSQLIDPELYRPPTDLHKSRYLWNAHNLYPLLFHGGVSSRVVVVEGFKACLWCIQQGYPFTVALMGSSLSESQARLLERLAREVVLFLDQDRAGANGTDAAIQRLRRSCFLYLARYPRSGKLQPDSLTRDEIAAAIDESQPYYRRA